MNILALNTNNLEPVLQLMLSNVIDDYPDVFKDELEQLPGETHFITDPSVTPVVLPVRRIPVSLTEKVKNELYHLSAKYVITPVQQPTDWVSNLVVTMKKSGDLRLFLDPQKFNKAFIFNCLRWMIYYLTCLMLNCFLLLIYVLRIGTSY